MVYHRYQAHLDLLRPRNVAEEPIGRFTSYTDSNDCVEHGYSLFCQNKNERRK